MELSSMLKYGLSILTGIITLIGLVASFIQIQDYLSSRRIVRLDKTSVPTIIKRPISVPTI